VPEGRRRTFKDPRLQARFERDGYVIVTALDEQAAREARDRASAAVAAEPAINDPQGALYGTLFDPDKRAAGERICDDLLTPSLGALLDSYRHEGGYVVAKLPGSPRLDMHQHQPVTADVYEPSVHCWLTLDDVDASTGALRVVPGSHAILRHVQSFATPSYFASFGESLERHYAVDLQLQAGQAVIFERSLLHGSAPNRSATSRLRVLGTAIPMESRLCILAEHRPGAFEALEVGDAVIEPTLYCIADGNRAALKSAGTIDNRNVELTEDEFAALLQRGEKVRPGFDPLDSIRTAAGAV
jgi:hypothetical protein